MGDIHNMISLGLGTPSDLGHFLLVGLSLSAETATADATIEVRADAGTIRVQPDVGTIQVRPDTGAIQV